MSIVEWTEPQGDDSGVDHLGMRVAGESAYGALVDFTTTVTWRARYLSYLCWSLRQAWRSAGGGDDPEEAFKVDRAAWRRSLKRRDYILAAATLAADQAPQTILHVAGSDKLGRALRAIGVEQDARLTVAEDHLAARSGSLDIYLGVLRALGLVSTAQRIDLPTHRGEALADAFQASLARSGVASIFDAESLSRADLERLGNVCGLSRLAPHDEAPIEVSIERQRIADQIVDWSHFGGGHGPSSRRILSIGLLLSIVRLSQRVVTLDEFRAALLLDNLKLPDGTGVPIELSPAYDEIRNYWRCYQAHAYATYALEALLGVVLARAFDGRGEREGVPYGEVLDTVVSSVGEAGLTTPDPGLSDWHGRSLADVMTYLESVVRAGREAPDAEPEMHARIAAAAWQDDDYSEWARDASLLLLLSVARLRGVMRAAPNAWIGDRDMSRLPPMRLIEDVEAAVAAGQTVAGYLRVVLHELVVRQHQRNALRKLAADPRRFTARLAVEQGLLIPLSSHHPGTSNPRFGNAITFLRDLGYLGPNEASSTTVDGDRLLDEIARRYAT